MGRFCRVAALVVAETVSKIPWVSPQASWLFFKERAKRRYLNQQMADSPLRTAYNLEGSSEEWLGLGVSREAMQGALVTLILIFDFLYSGPQVPLNPLGSYSISDRNWPLARSRSWQWIGKPNRQEPNRLAGPAGRGRPRGSKNQERLNASRPCGACSQAFA
jgi:hypothetical protein